MDVVVQDGRAVDLSGNNEHPYTRGALCAKVNRSLDRVYAPDRLLFPVKRVGPKGPGATFERISWDEAIDTIVQKMRAAIAEHGPQSILPYSYSGTLGLYQGWGFDRRFAHLLGASRLDRTICEGAYIAAAHYLPDLYQGFPPEGLVESRLIIFWGNNPLNTGLHIWRWALEARRRGAKIISIDPYRSRTARVCDEHLFIRPGTDAALALAMMKVIVDEELVDHDYVDRYTFGFDQLVDRLHSALAGGSRGRLRRARGQDPGTRPRVRSDPAGGASHRVRPAALPRRRRGRPRPRLPPRSHRRVERCRRRLLLHRPRHSERPQPRPGRPP